MKTTVEIMQAAALLAAGELVAFPTETVYGLGADAANEQAIGKIFAVKERPLDHPLIVHLASSEQLSAWALEVSPLALRLAQAFWPGPLTMIFKKQAQVLDIVTAGQDTVGIRIPSHPVAQALLHQFGRGVVAPSANKFTHISPTTAEAVAEELGGQIGLILEGGACAVGLESTIIDMSGEQPVILRPGMLTAKAIADTLGIAIATAQPPVMRVPGLHYLHYAPTTQARLVSAEELVGMLKTLRDAPVAVMTYSGVVLPNNDAIQVYPMPNDAKEYAHDLYHVLRKLDHQGFKQIIIESVPLDAEWEAIRDRLIKATAER